jgi:hypothetical protein
MTKSRLAALLAIVVAAGDIAGATQTAGAAESAAPESITDNAQADQFAQSRQRLNGNVGSVDAGNGTVTVRTAAGELTLHFPPESLDGTSSGAPLIVEYAIAKGEATTWAYNAPDGAGAQRVFANVEEANHDTGWISVRWHTGMLKLVFPPRTIQNLNPGDRVTVDLAFSRMISPRGRE